MFGFIQRLFHRKRKERVPFEVFLRQRTLDDPDINLEDLLNAYIRKYNLRICHLLDEPEETIDARTKLCILEEFEAESEAGGLDCSELQSYMHLLRMSVESREHLIKSNKVIRNIKDRQR